MSDTCTVCGNHHLEIFDYVDFNKWCTGSPEKVVPIGLKVCYKICEFCNFLFAPDLCRWSANQFKAMIYNDSYVLYDPEYEQVRPAKCAEYIKSLYSKKDLGKHLDYGGGNGKLSEILIDSGIDSTNYEPFSSSASSFPSSKFKFITAFEVFEHVPDPNKMMTNFAELLEPSGLIVFSTVLNDNNIKRGHKLDWWYAAPRNGHISLYSQKSLEILGSKHGFSYRNIMDGLHAFTR